MSISNVGFLKPSTKPEVTGFQARGEQQEPSELLLSKATKKIIKPEVTGFQASAQGVNPFGPAENSYVAGIGATQPVNVNAIAAKNLGTVAVGGQTITIEEGMNYLQEPTNKEMLAYINSGNLNTEDMAGSAYSAFMGQQVYKNAGDKELHPNYQKGTDYEKLCMTM